MQLARGTETPPEIETGDHYGEEVSYHTHFNGGRALILYISHDGHHDDAVTHHFEKWLEASDPDKRLVRIEGRVPETAAFQSEHVARQSERGELAMLAYLARCNAIPLETLEPTTQRQASEILAPSSGILPENYWFYLVARQIPQALRGLCREDLSREELTHRMGSYVTSTAMRIGDELDSRWRFSFVSSENRFRYIFEKLYPGKVMDLTDADFFATETINSMYDPKSTIQYVSYAVNQHRERHMQATIAQDMAMGRHVFTTVGSLHYTNMRHLPSVREDDNYLTKLILQMGLASQSQRMEE